MGTRVQLVQTRRLHCRKGHSSLLHHPSLDIGVLADLKQALASESKALLKRLIHALTHWRPGLVDQRSIVAMLHC